MTKRRLDVSVFGRVQGVYFRHYTLERAERLGLDGWVANRRDGSVRVVAEGEEASLRRLLEWLYQGPAMAVVERVDEQWLEATGEFAGFTVRG